MNEDRINEILKKFKNVNIAVYGDFCLDVYWDMDPEGSEVSVETGLKECVFEEHLSLRKELLRLGVSWKKRFYLFRREKCIQPHHLLMKWGNEYQDWHSSVQKPEEPKKAKVVMVIGDGRDNKEILETRYNKKPTTLGKVLKENTLNF